MPSTPRALSAVIALFGSTVTSANPEVAPSPATSFRLPSRSSVVYRDPDQGRTLLPDASYSLGIFTEELLARTNDRYRIQPPGLSMAVDQPLHGSWSGGFQVRLLALTPLDPSQADDILPLNIMSRIQWEAFLDQLTGWSLLAPIRPFARGGLGLLWFGIVGSRILETPPGLRNQEAVAFGGGLKFVLTPALAVVFSWENLRGTRDFNFFTNVWTIEIAVGNPPIPR